MQYRIVEIFIHMSTARTLALPQLGETPDLVIFLN